MSDPAIEFDHIHIISRAPHQSARWYVQMLGAEVVADTVARDAPQIHLDLGGKTVIIRGQRPGEAPCPPIPFAPSAISRVTTGGVLITSGCSTTATGARCAMNWQPAG